MMLRGNIAHYIAVFIVLYFHCPSHKGGRSYSLMATGRKDLLWRSVVHPGNLSLRLKVLWYDSSVACRGWEALSIILSSLLSILLSEAAFLMNLLSLLASDAFTLLPQHTTALKMMLATTE